MANWEKILTQHPSMTDLSNTSHSTSRYLRGDGTWATPTDTNTNTTYSASTGLSLVGTAFSITSGGVTGTQLATGAINHPSKLSTGVVSADAIDSGAVGASELNVSGNGTTSQFLRSDGDGTMTWATPSSGLSSVNNSNWSGTDLSVANGGTGSSTASGAKTNLGLSTTSNVTFNNIDSNGNVFVGNSLTVDGGDAEFYNDLTCQGTIDSQAFQGNGSGLTNINNTCWGGTDLAVINGGTGSSTASGARSNLGVSVEKCDWQWATNWYTRFGYYYYPNSSYGVSTTDWSTSSATAKTSWAASYMPPFIAPYAFTLKECFLRGSPTSSQTFELILKKGTPSYNNSASATSITNVSGGGNSLETLSCTAYRRNELGSSSLNLSVAKGDILVPQLRRTTNTTSSTYYYFRGVFSIVGERSF